MFHTESGERSAAQELMALHIDMSVRRVAEFPPDKYAALQVATRDTAGDPAEGCRKKDRVAGLAWCVNTCSPYMRKTPDHFFVQISQRAREAESLSRGTKRSGVRSGRAAD